MRFIAADGFQVISHITRSVQQAGRVLLVDALPPQLEKQQTVLQDGQALFHVGFEGAGLAVSGIFGKPKVRIGSEPGSALGHGFTEV